MDKLYDLLTGICPEVDFKNEKSLITDGYIDSFDIVSIISAIEEEYRVSVPVDSMIPENFESLELIMQLVSSLEGGSV